MAGVGSTSCRQCGGSDASQNSTWQRLDRTPAISAAAATHENNQKTHLAAVGSNPCHLMNEIVSFSMGTPRNFQRFFTETMQQCPPRSRNGSAVRHRRPLDNRTARSYRRRHLVLMLARALPDLLDDHFRRRFPQGVVHGRPILRTSSHKVLHSTLLSESTNRWPDLCPRRPSDPVFPSPDSRGGLFWAFSQSLWSTLFNVGPTTSFSTQC